MVLRRCYQSILMAAMTSKAKVLFREMYVASGNNIKPRRHTPAAMRAGQRSPRPSYDLAPPPSPLLVRSDVLFGHPCGASISCAVLRPPLLPLLVACPRRHIPVAIREGQVKPLVLRCCYQSILMAAMINKAKFLFREMYVAFSNNIKWPLLVSGTHGKPFQTGDLIAVQTKQMHRQKSGKRTSSDGTAYIQFISFHFDFKIAGC